MEFSLAHHLADKTSAVEQEKKYNYYTLLLLPFLAALIGVIVMVVMHFWLGAANPSAQVPTPVSHPSAVALSEFIRAVWG